MDDRNTDNHAKKPRKRGRRQHANGRWTQPASPLQAARFALEVPAKQVVLALQHICEGHNGNPCRIDPSKLSEYETRARPPSLRHIVALCRYYQKSPEELGLINWRDEAADPPDRKPAAAGGGAVPPDQHSSCESDEEEPQPDEEQLVMDWLLRSAATIATVVMAALADYPVKPISRHETDRQA